ncbi:MAG: sulfur reduction protein DsrE [Pelagibacterales bacterium]|nr:sulfur reduction protein DsrE [Pelagibacterales bacterium]OUU63584.1 MAG: sulfur reduction protein DsrE [Alphaproteobacteria bacterium TMED62]|tara:strand:+ start:4028 stop:4381 length:354 start_codon:yes stop_codon:yes gene_type:complete
MHFAISASWGPTDPTRAMLPFIFAASALQAKDTVTIMLFHDAVHLASIGVAKKIVPVGLPQRFDEVLNDNNSKIIVCKPCAEVRNIFEKDCLDKITFGGMNDFHIASKLPETKTVCY